MGRKLSDEECQAMVAEAVNAKASAMAIKMLGDAGLEAPAIIAALLTGATTLIQTAYAPPHRLHVLNSMLAETIHEWADAAGANAGQAATAGA